jgi:5-formyltetrahydrofolate cyclo-ligase
VALTKPELRALYPPLGDAGEAARFILPLITGRCFCFVSGKNECSTQPVIEHCLSNGIPLAVPLCEGGGIMTARMLTELSQLSAGKYGIMEPPSDAAVMTDPSVVIVPGICFDSEGFRLGRGGGYYDRYLTGRNCLKIGLCRSSRLTVALPRDGWDIPVDVIATERGADECRIRRKN